MRSLYPKGKEVWSPVCCARPALHTSHHTNWMAAREFAWVFEVSVQSCVHSYTCKPSDTALGAGDVSAGQVKCRRRLT